MKKIFCLCILFVPLFSFGNEIVNSFKDLVETKYSLDCSSQPKELSQRFFKPIKFRATIDCKDSTGNPKVVIFYQSKAKGEPLESIAISPVDDFKL